jgi:hypothetical protein
VNDGQPTYLTKLKKKLAIFFFSGVILTDISIFGKSCEIFYVRKLEKENRKAQLGFYCVILPRGY